MRDPESKADRIQITYHKGDEDRSARILVNGQFLKSVLPENRGNDFYTVEYSIAPEIIRRSNGQLEIKIEQ